MILKNSMNRHWVIITSFQMPKRNQRMNTYSNAVIKKINLNSYEKVNNKKIDGDNICTIKLIVSVFLLMFW